ncbi:MAG: sigma-70 family RNA polymerase sigma factor [Pirellulales bacterium]|nr:sigma-70 family RNA polymerase sigma factor [Pirellulales bacterium]
MSAPIDNEQFARLFAAHHRRLFSYVRSMVPNRADADEVFQETCVVLWRKFADYDPERDFAPWALAVAHNQVRTWRHQVRRRSKIVFSDDLVQELAGEEALLCEELDRRSDFLEWCIGQLSPADRDLIAAYYDREEAPKDIARRLGQSVNAVYKAASRIRQTLFECIQRKIAAEDR